MAGCEQKVQESLSCLVHEAGVPAGLDRCWNSEEVGRNVSKRMGFLAVVRQVGKEQNLPSSLSLYRLPAGVAQIKSMSACLKIQINRICLPASNINIRSRSP